MPIELKPSPVIMGCYYCISIMPEDEVITDPHHDVIECPTCGMDSITPYSTCLSIGDILIDLENRAKKAWAIVDEDGNPTGDHLIEKYRSKNETK